MIQVIGRIKAIQEATGSSKVEVIEEEKDDQSVASELDELKAVERGKESERMLVGLLSLLDKILVSLDEKTSARIVEEQDLIKQIF